MGRNRFGLTAAVLAMLAGPALGAEGYEPVGFLTVPAEVKMGAASSIAIAPNGRLYVLHRGDPSILMFSADGKYLGGWGSGQFKVAHGLRFDRAGNLWTTDNGSHVIQKFSPDGKLLQMFGQVGVAGGGKTGFKSPDDLVFASNGDIYVADSGNARIVHLNSAGKYVADWGKKGKAAGEFNLAHALAIDAKDRIYVADRGNNRVQVFEKTGQFVAQWTGFGNPFGLLMNGSELLVSDGDAKRIIHLNMTGAVARQWGNPELLKLPHFMAVDSKGTLFVCEVDGKRVQMFRRTGSGASDSAEIHRQDEIDAAHKAMFQRREEPSRRAADVTAQFAQALPGGGTAAKVARKNFIDEHLFGRMERDGIPHAPLASDEEFARRAYLDATGRIPDANELLTFLSDTDPGRRDKLVDRLVDGPNFIDRWTFYFEDLFRAGGRMGYGLNLFHFWVREWLRLDRPVSDIATELLTGAGKTSFSSPGALYFARDFVKAKDDPEEPGAHDLVNIPDTVDEFTITYSKVFLGMNLACISCHDGKGHLEKVNLFLTGKRREDFFRQAAFYGKTRQIMNWEDGYQANTEYTVDDVAPGYDTKAVSIVRVPRNGGKNDPKFLLTDEAPRTGNNQRAELARMLTQHIQFSRAFTNRIWSELMGFGIVEPVDEFDLGRYDAKNPPPAPWTLQPSNPELLDAMAVNFQKSNFSFRGLVKTIMKSSAYQLSSRFSGEWKPEYARYYARKYVRMLSAAELADAITTATAQPGSYGTGANKSKTVMGMPDPKQVKGEMSGFLKVFGQSNRDDMPKKTPPSSLQAMLLMQSKLVTERVLAQKGSRTEQLLKAFDDDRALVDRIYLSTVSRRPADGEMEVGLKALKEDRKRGAENLQWALINSPEFLFNY